MPNNLVIFPVGGGGGSNSSSSGGSSTDIFVTAFIFTNPKGLMGIGTVKNTDAANTLDIRETVTDAFGVTSSFITSVSPGNTYMLDPQTNINAGCPPYVSYAVALRSTAAGFPATFVIRFVGLGTP